MAYSVDLAYLEFYKCAAEGKYDSGLLKKRLIVTSMAAGSTAVGAFRVLGRVISLVTEIAKVIFYSIASIFTLGNYGNGKRLGDHCKLLGLNVAGLVAQPFQVAVHALATAVGIISPTAAYRMMQGASTPLGMITSKENEIWQDYKTPEVCDKISNAIKAKVITIFKGPRLLRNIMINLVYEFTETVDKGLVIPLALMNRFPLFGANPQVLTEKQRSLRPILLLNGNHSHQGTFLPLFHALQKSGNERPVYSFNLYNTDDLSVVINEVEAIRKQYKLENKPFAIDMVGHSMGAWFIQEILRTQNIPFSVGRAITLGTPFIQGIYQNHFEGYDLTGSRDLLAPEKSVLPDDHKAEIDTGHNGLVFHPKSLQTIQNFLCKGKISSS